jgi:hypothetical protein
MADWLICASCGLKHTARPDGQCPQCRQPVAIEPGGSAARVSVPPASVPPSAAMPGTSTALPSVCEACGAKAPTHPVTFRQNIGLVILRFPRTVRGRFCEPCVNRYFSETTWITALAGWWGVISFFATPIILISNLGEISAARRAFRTPGGTGVPGSPLTRPTSGPIDRSLAVASLVAGLLSLICSILLVPALAGIVLGIVALTRASRRPEAYGGKGFAIAGIVTGTFSLVLFALLVHGIATAPATTGPQTAGADLFEQADRQIGSTSAEAALGNTAEARRMAAELNGLCKSLAVIVQKYGDKDSSVLSAVDAPCVTYADARQDSVCFLVRVPSLRRYPDEMTRSTLGILWHSARDTVRKSYGRDDVKTAVALRGILLYGAVAAGTAGESKPPVFEVASSARPASLSPFFAGPLAAEVSPAGQEPPLSSPAAPALAVTPRPR